MIGKFLVAAAAATMAATPVVAAPANPAASLSVAPSVRAATPTSEANELAGVGIIPAVLLAGIAAIGIIAIVNGDSDVPDSN